MTKLTEILCKYAAGEMTADKVNAELEKYNFNVRINPDRCKLTAAQIKDGWGMLDTGTGTLDPARMVNGELVNVDCGKMKAFFFHDGKEYAVHGKKLEEIVD
jgi:hypothetical protein